MTFYVVLSIPFIYFIIMHLPFVSTIRHYSIKTYHFISPDTFQSHVSCHQPKSFGSPKILAFFDLCFSCVSSPVIFKLSSLSLALLCPDYPLHSFVRYDAYPICGSPWCYPQNVTEISLMFRLINTLFAGPCHLAAKMQD